jgi:hypothetical protein
MTSCLYRNLLGARFDTLPAKVRELHDIGSGATWTGRARVERGTSLMARALAVLTRLPPTTPDMPLVVTFAPVESGETWRRQFGDHVFPSLQQLGDGVILERIGPVTLELRPEAGPDGLRLSLTGAKLLGIGAPRPLLARVATREYEVDGRYTFEVEADLPIFGRLVRYRGWLERAR